MNALENIILQQEEACPATVNQTVCVQGTVTITPSITRGEVQTFCRGGVTIGGCAGTLQESCSFTVSQSICVQVPLEFSAEVEVTPDGVVCGTPGTGACTTAVGCTRSIGFYRDNEGVIAALIAAGGGSVTLGNGSGLSYVVSTPAEANDVLYFNTPVPPAPSTPPLGNQYQVLYAQLLAAKLNVISLAEMGVAICPFVIEAIEAADAFLGSSQSPQQGAPLVQEPLEQFNAGNAEGCPAHCEG